MNNSLKRKSLFSFKSLFFRNIFAEYEYPWEILPHIREIINSLIDEGISNYVLIDEGILIGKDVSIAASAHIEPPCIIGRGTEIRHGAYIRGSVFIGEKCVIGNSSEIKNSIIMDKVQIPHYNYVGDSVLGEAAHLGAGAICSNLRSDKQTVKITYNGSVIDTGLRKLGAILGDNAEIGCGAVLCPGAVIGKNTNVYPLTLVRGFCSNNSILKNDGTVVKKRT